MATASIAREFCPVALKLLVPPQLIVSSEGVVAETIVEVEGDTYEACVLPRLMPNGNVVLYCRPFATQGATWASWHPMHDAVGAIVVQHYWCDSQDGVEGMLAAGSEVHALKPTLSLQVVSLRLPFKRRHFSARELSEANGQIVIPIGVPQQARVTWPSWLTLL